MRTFGLAGKVTPGGAYGLGELTGGVFARAAVTTQFNVIDQYHATPHNGVDLATYGSTDILAPLDGIVAANYAHIWPGPGPLVFFPNTPYEKVVYPGDYDRSGNVLILIHEGPWRLPDGSTVPNAATLYGHLAELPPLPVGTRVQAGQVIGKQGTTGYSTGPHLHWTLAFQTAGGIFPPNMSDTANLADPLQYVGLPVQDVDGIVVEGKIEDGLSIVLLTGLVDQLAELDAVSVTATVGGKYVAYIPNAPSFVNAEFAAAHPNGLNRTPVIVRR